MSKCFYFYLIICSIFSAYLRAEKDIANGPIELTAECEPITTVAGCVNLISGSFFQVDHDFSLNGSIPFTFTRYYDSKHFFNSILGVSVGTNLPLVATSPQRHHKHSFVMITDREGFVLPFKSQTEQELRLFTGI